MNHYSLQKTGEDEWAKGAGAENPLTDIEGNIQTSTDTNEAWYTIDPNHALILSNPSGFVGGARPPQHP